VLTAGTAWLLWAVASAFLVKSNTGIPFVWALEGQLLPSVFMALLSIPFWWITVRMMSSARWYWTLLVHVPSSLAYAAIVYEANILILQMFSSEAAQAVAKVREWILFYYFLIYGLQFAIYHGIQTLSRLRFRERQTMELATLSREQQLTVLKSQINPHFFFNTLNSISAMVTEDAEETRAMIAQLADLVRYAIDMSKRDLVPLREELEFVRSYLALESRRFGDRLHVGYKVDPAALDIGVPPLVLQPLAENAITHGIEPSERGGTIEVNISLGGGLMSVCVRDSGVGMRRAPSPTLGDRIGLRNTDARLRNLFGDRFGLWTRPIESGGFEVGFSIPLRREVEG